MTDTYQWNELATYNAERSRGIVHTPEWDERMALEQQRFNDHQRAKPRTLDDLVKDSNWLRKIGAR